MGAKREPSAAMKNMYSRKREDTLKRISDAIKDMKKWEEPVTKKRIMERAGVSSGTLSKPYVLELLKKERVCQFSEIETTCCARKSDSATKELSIALRENKKLNTELSKAVEQVEKLRSKRDWLNDELKKIKEENAQLRGQRQLLLERLYNAGISIGNIRS